MSIANPLTASSDLQRVPRPSLSPLPEGNPAKTDLGVYSNDILEISQQGLEKQKAETQVNAQQQATSADIDKLAKDVVRVSSTIGRAKSSGTLNAQQATALYNKIASLL